jgi:hypothetical protein
MRKFTIRLASALLCCLPCIGARADDHLAVLAAGGLVPQKSSEIAMESEDVTISIHRISVKYRFRNDSNRDIDAIVAFPLPGVSNGAADNYQLPSKDPTNFVDFRVFVQEERVTPKVEVRAFDGKTDITARLRSLGLPISAEDSRLKMAISKLGATDFAALDEEGLIQCSIYPNSHEENKNDCDAAWETRVRFYWTIHFPAKSTVEVRHEYKPVVGGGYLMGGSSNGEPGTNDLRDYCVSEDELRKVIEALEQKYPERYQKRDSAVVLWEREIEFILTTANYWSGPIGAFHLTVLTDDAGDIFRTCVPGLRRTSATRFELTRTNFRPDQELKLLILQLDKSP